MTFDIPLHHFGGKGPLIHFAHGNGYPPSAYRALCSHFTDRYEVIGAKMRPLWSSSNDPSVLDSWSLLAEDMAHFMRSKGMKKVIGLCHSLGGTISILAAYDNPDLFDRLILLDPVILSKESFLASESMTMSERIAHNPFARASSTRKDKWKNKSEVFEIWRGKKVFGRFNDQALWQLIEAAIMQNKHGATLAYSREWETQIYVTESYVLDKAIKLDIPITVIRAARRSVIMDKVWEMWKGKSPQTSFLDFHDGSHLFPMEAPDEVAAILREAGL